ncbi:MAG: DUF364 domain-containing protein [Bacteroidales bacterium]
MKCNNDILKTLFEKIHQNKKAELSYILGAKYVAVTNSAGHIGVCATLGNEIDGFDIDNLNFDCTEDRIVINALVNSYINYSTRFDGGGDIFSIINFDKYSSIVMIGYFGPLVNKFMGKNIALNIFDLDQREVPVLPMEQQAEYLSKADCVILTSTSISNNTFEGIVRNTPSSSDIFLLGPSTPMDDALFEYPNVKGLFGSVFKPFDENTLKIIADGGGTCLFKQYMEKIYKMRDDCGKS